MSLVGRVGRKRPRARFAMAVLYLLLSIGALTTLYPFATMVSMGMKNTADQDDGRLVPAFLVDEKALEEKYLFDKYAGGRAGQYLIDRHANPSARVGRPEAARRVEEAQLFIEASHACEARLSAAR